MSVEETPIWEDEEMDHGVDLRIYQALADSAR